MNAGLVVVKVEAVETGYTIPRGYPNIAVVIACEVRDGVARQSVGSGIVGEGSLQGHKSNSSIGRVNNIVFK